MTSAHSSEHSSPELALQVCAIVVAGGAGARMGTEERIRKQYRDLGGKPLLAWSIDSFLEHTRVTSVVVVLPREDVASPHEWLKTRAVRIVEGGPERSDSVRRGLDAVPTGTDIVLIHDGARPFVDAALVDRVIAGAIGGAAIPGIPATDTLKQVDSARLIVRTIDRSAIWQAQTPQGFRYDLLRRLHDALADDGQKVTDDASLCERAGVPVRVVDGDPRNVKITRSIDLDIARRMVGSDEAADREEALNAEHG